MSYFSKKSFTMRQVVGLLTVVFLGISVITYAAVSFTDFTSGTPILASEMNTKLNALKDAVNKITAFEHVTTVGNISGSNYTIIDNPATNNDPNAILVVTNNLNLGAYNNHVSSVWYDGSKWTIYYDDGSIMPAGLAYNVMVIK